MQHQHHDLIVTILTCDGMSREQATDKCDSDRRFGPKIQTESCQFIYNIKSKAHATTGLEEWDDKKKKSYVCFYLCPTAGIDLLTISLDLKQAVWGSYPLDENALIRSVSLRKMLFAAWVSILTDEALWRMEDSDGRTPENADI